MASMPSAERGEVGVALSVLSRGRGDVDRRLAPFGGVAGVVPVRGARIAVETDVEDVVAIPEDSPRPVAVMEVDAEDRDAGRALVKD